MRMSKRQNWITEVKMTTEYGSVARRDGTSTPPSHEVYYLGKRPFEQRMRYGAMGYVSCIKIGKLFQHTVLK